MKKPIILLMCFMLLCALPTVIAYYSVRVAQYKVKECQVEMKGYAQQMEELNGRIGSDDKVLESIKKNQDEILRILK